MCPTIIDSKIAEKSKEHAISGPNNILASGKSRGFDWLITHNGMGFRCGYIAVPPNHPWHGKHYDDIKANAHGGLTFAGQDTEYDHWWIGFDCAHFQDAQDPSLPHKFDMMMDGVVRTQEYVQEECIGLCKQAYQNRNLMAKALSKITGLLCSLI